MIGASIRNIGIALPGAANPNDTNVGFSPTYYPGTISPTEAQAISLAAGEERSVQFAPEFQEQLRRRGREFSVREGRASRSTSR